MALCGYVYVSVTSSCGFMWIYVCFSKLLHLVALCGCMYVFIKFIIVAVCFSKLIILSSIFISVLIIFSSPFFYQVSNECFLFFL